MVKLTLGPLETKVAEELARRRGVSVIGLIIALLHEEAAISLVGLADAKAKVSTDGR